MHLIAVDAANSEDLMVCSLDIGYEHYEIDYEVNENKNGNNDYRRERITEKD